MSYSLDGKVAVCQSIRNPGYDGFGVTAPCSRCGSIIEIESGKLNATHSGDLEKNTHFYYVYTVLNTKTFIYESKSGFLSVYCSKYCRDRHNHRFSRKG